MTPDDDFAELSMASMSDGDTEEASSLPSAWGAEGASGGRNQSGSGGRPALLLRLRLLALSHSARQAETQSTWEARHRNARAMDRPERHDWDCLQSGGEDPERLGRR
jgi:hypothetical protein